MQTIIITILRGMTARNLLQNYFFTILRDRFRVVIVTPAANDQRFRQTFAHPNVSFVYFNEKAHTRSDKIFFGLSKYLILNHYIKLKLRYGIRGLSRPEDLSAARYYLFVALFTPLSKIRFLRDLLRWFDYRFAQRSEVAAFTELIAREKPSLIVSTSPMSDQEVALLKAGRKKNIATIAIPKSWDSLSKAGYRAKADTLVVWSSFMQEQAVTFQNYRPENITIIGIPQFDAYHDQSRLVSREAFCAALGLDPTKRIVVFTSEGKAVPEDVDIAMTLAELIRTGALAVPCQLLIRPHFIYHDEERKFEALFGVPDVVVDLSNEPSAEFRDRADYSRVHHDRLINTMAHADIVVNVTSTITLDAVAFDKPVINAAFGSPKDRDRFQESVLMLYESDHYRALMATGASILARSRQELVEAMNRYLRDPSYKREQRALLRQRFCYVIDGKAGKRFADLVTARIGQAPISHP